MKNDEIIASVKHYSDELFGLAHDIFNNPEGGEKEFFASARICEYLTDKGFAVERGIAGLPTAFRAEWQNMVGGPSIGLICEYDAIEGFGHVCGHHLQSPVCIGAALAVREHICDQPYKLVIYGTPAEETKGSKVTMIDAGCFRDIDVALSYHSGSATMAASEAKALQPMDVVFHGKPSHASSAPQNGRSALDAALLSFHAVECMREHVLETSRMHYTIREGTGPTNTVHEQAHAGYTLRAADKRYLENDMLPRFRKILDGACMMTETTYDITYKIPYYNLVTSSTLTTLANEKAHELDLRCLAEDTHIPTGSTDVGNLSWILPTLMMYVFYCSAPAHSRAWLDAGLSGDARRSMEEGAELFAAMMRDLIINPEYIKSAKDDFERSIAG